MAWTISNKFYPVFRFAHDFNQRSNLQVGHALLEIMGKSKDYIEFIADRPGHDLRYAIDASATEAELGWTPKHGNFEEKLVETVSFYSKN